MKNKGVLIVLAIAIVLAIVGIMVFGGNKSKEEEKPKTNIGTQTPTNNVEEYVQTREDGTKVNTSNKLNQMKKLENFEIGNIQLTSKNDMSTVLATVKNTGSTTTQLTEVVLTLVDKNGNEIIAMDGLIKPLQAGESTELNIGATADFANSYDFKIVKK